MAPADATDAEGAAAAAAAAAAAWAAARARWAHLLPPTPPPLPPDAAGADGPRNGRTPARPYVTLTYAQVRTAAAGASADPSRSRPGDSGCVRPPTHPHAPAQGIDGSIASSRRIQLPLSNAQSMAMTHALRGSHDAILVGVGTVIADDPKLTARIPVRLASGPPWWRTRR